VRSGNAPFSQAGRDYPAGSLVIRVEDNPSDLHQRLERLASETGAEIDATDSGWVERGPNFGSGQVVRLQPPQVALAWDAPTSPDSAGALRYVLERRFGYPVTVIRTETLATADLRHYQVLILPDGAGYERAFDALALERLASWVNSGGTLIAIERALELLIDEEVGLLSTSAEERASNDEETSPAKTLLATEEDYRAAIEPEDEAPAAVAGALLRARTDDSHWLAAGLPARINVLYSGTTIYRPITLDQGTNVAVFEGPDEILASGHLWDENRLQLAHKPFAIVEAHGSGWVIGFTADPTTRAYLDGLDLLLLNAIFRAPALASPAP
jgi:hypothetical protein